MVKIRFKKLHPNAVIPTRATEGSSGYDITALDMKSSTDVEKGIYIEYRTGLAIEVPKGYEAVIRPRSSIRSKNVEFMFRNAPATIDSDYRGELVIIFTKPRRGPVYAPGDRVAQLVIQKTLDVEFEEVDELSATKRGEEGFGSTGT